MHAYIHRYIYIYGEYQASCEHVVQTGMYQYTFKIYTYICIYMHTYIYTIRRQHSADKRLGGVGGGGGAGVATSLPTRGKLDHIHACIPTYISTSTKQTCMHNCICTYIHPSSHSYIHRYVHAHTHILNSLSIKR